jgi:DNA-binding IscR family transcriptional regulator
VGNLVRTLDGPLAPIQCASRRLYRRCEDCVDETHCAVRLVMLEARDAIARVLDNTSLEQMRALGEAGMQLVESKPRKKAAGASMDMA